MKLSKILISSLSLSTIVIPTSICSCTDQESDHLTSLSTNYLNIENGKLKGFIDAYKYKEDIPPGEYKLTITKDVTSIAPGAFSFQSLDVSDSMLLIKKIDAQEESSCTTFGAGAFDGCENIHTVVLPSSFIDFQDCFIRCTRLQTFDLTNITGSVKVTDNWTAPKNKGWPKVGTIIYKENNPNQKELANKLLAAINWEGSSNTWTLIAK